MGLLIDLDQTLINSQLAEPYRRARNWQAVYKLIPELRPYTGITELLEELSSLKIPICIVTSSPRPYCERVIAYNGWTVQATVCYHDTTRWKPYPDPLLKGLERLNLQASDVVAVGDAAKDIQAAKAGKIYSIGTLWGSLEKEALIDVKPDFICKEVNDLRNQLLKIFS